MTDADWTATATPTTTRHRQGGGGGMSEINAATRRAIEMLAGDSPDPAATREKAEGYVADDACYCCGTHALCDDACGITRCYICCGRGHGDEALEWGADR